MFPVIALLLTVFSLGMLVTGHPWTALLIMAGLYLIARVRKNMKSRENRR